MANTAPSGFALAFATGGVRCTFLSSAGMLHVGSDSVPENFPPNSVVSNFTFFIDSFAAFLNAGLPHSAQQRIRIVHGIHASIVWPAVYLYFQSLGAVVSVALPSPPTAISDRSMKRVFGCHTNRRNSAVQITENTPATTSVMRWNWFVLEARYCMTANVTPETSAPGHTSKACPHVPPSIFTNVTTSQNGTSIETHGRDRKST